MKNYCFILLLFTLSFYAQNDTISVVKHTDKDIVVNKESKIVYRGMPNDLYINVPNSKSFTATAEGLKKITKTNYILSPKAGNEVIISIDIILKNGKKITEKHKFRIRNLTALVTSINHIQGKIIKLQKGKLNNAIISVDPLDKNLNFKLIITGFVISLPNGRNFEIKGDKIKKEIFDIINISSSKYDTITISDIKVRTNSSFQGCIRPAPIQIEIF